MSSLDLWQELRGTESAGRLIGREHRLKDPGRRNLWEATGRVRTAAAAA
jgi:hypothetical protein